MSIYISKIYVYVDLLIAYFVSVYTLNKIVLGLNI